MRAAIAVSLAAAALLGTSVHAAPQASFSTPSQWQGEGNATAEWLLLVLSPESDLQGEYKSVGQTTATYHEAAKVRSQSEAASVRDVFPVGSRQEKLSNVDASLVATAGNWKSLYLRGTSIEVDYQGAGEILALRDQTLAAAALLENSYPSGTIRQDGQTVPGASVTISGAFSAPTRVRVRAQGLTEAEFHNVTVACASASCPEQAAGLGTSPSPFAGFDTLTYTQLEGTEATVTLDGTVIAAAFGASTLSTDLSGQMRMTGASLDACAAADCVQANGETLVAGGEISMADLRVSSSDPERIEGTLLLRSGTARLDESVIDASLLAPVSAVAAAGIAVGGWLVAKLLAGLFTRVRSSSALEHPKRQLVWEIVQERPGISFNDLRRRTGISNGTIRHHLSILIELGLIHSKKDGQNLRFFGTGIDGQAVPKLVKLRDEANAQLVDLIDRQPGVAQGDLLALLPGVPRSSIQFRLKGLEEAGLVSRERKGRTVRYRSNFTGRNASQANLAIPSEAI